MFFSLFLILVSSFYFVKEIVSSGKPTMSLKSISSWFSHHPSLLVIIILGLSLRLLLTALPSLNFDTRMFMAYGEIFSEGKRNIYLFNYSYNYSPAIFYIVGILYTITKSLSFSFYPAIHRAFISIFDVLTLFTLLAIAKKNKISPTRTAVFFFLNPVSILLSGYHAHLDNIAVFFLLLGSWYYFCSNLPFKKIATWILLTIGFIIKHIIPFQVLLIFLYLYKNKTKGLSLFVLTVAAFLSTFIPFYNTSESRFVINEYVIGYQGLATISGITAIIRYLCVDCEIGNIKYYTLYKYIFMCTGILFSFFLIRFKDVFRSLLLSLLFFIAFTSGHSAQYFILPISVGALFPSGPFLIYTAAVTLFLFVFQIESGIPIYVKIILLNVVWLSSLLWFFSELLKVYEPAGNIYRKTFNILKKGKALK